jgi:hypothetical protein
MPNAIAQVRFAFLEDPAPSSLEHGVKSVAVSAGNMRCPHKEEEDFPLGDDCPFCPFWAGKLGSNRRD